MPSILLALLGALLVACAPERLGADASPPDSAHDTSGSDPSIDTSTEPSTDSGADSGADTGDSAVDTTCAELETRACACDDTAAVGSQRCLADSSGWGACACTTYGASLYVDPHAPPGGDGSRDAPLATLDDAVVAVQETVAEGLADGGLVVWLAGGTYPRTTRFLLSAATSGRPGAPVVWRGIPGDNGVWNREYDGAMASFDDTSNNLLLTTSPFIDEAAGDLHLDPSGRAFGVPGFVDFPLDEVGVVR